jgi:hypothetical protein
MQLPVQGKFEERPGWALRPAWGQQYGRSQSGGGKPVWGQQYGRREAAVALRPDSPWARQNERSTWGRQRMPETRAFLRGLGGYIPAAPFSYNPLEDMNLKAQWTNQYYAKSVEYADGVIAALRSMGFDVQVLGVACDPAAGCLGMMLYSAIINKDGKTMDTSIGNPVRYDSPQQEASDIAYVFGIYAVPSQSFSSGINNDALVQAATVPSSTPTYEQWLQTATQAPSATTTTATATQTTTAAASYRKDVQLLAPDGYRTGGRFTMKIWGSPGQTVEIEAWQNGQSHGRSAFGTTDASGYYEISGSWLPEHAGRWQENVYVGGEVVGRLDFELANPAQTEQPGNVTVTPELPEANQPPQPGSGTPGTGGGTMTPGVVPPPPSGGFPWLLLVGGGLALFLLGGSKGK